MLLQIRLAIEKVFGYLEIIRLSFKVYGNEQNINQDSDRLIPGSSREEVCGKKMVEC
jgi:hypothetical protein